MFLITGGSGFIGSNFINHILKNTSENVVNIDILTNSSSLIHTKNTKRLKFHKVNIQNKKIIEKLITIYRPKYFINFAAESHVDTSIEKPEIFLKTNILGTANIINLVHQYNQYTKKKIKFFQISTDEVFGDLATKKNTSFNVDEKYDPSSPYSASKAGADLIIKSWNRTFNFKGTIINSSNNYGPNQNIEKLIPNILLRSYFGKPILVYGNGKQKRDWLYVEDCVEAIFKCIKSNIYYPNYLVGTNKNLTNLELITIIDNLLKKHFKKSKFQSPIGLIQNVVDRPGHDLSYKVDHSFITKKIGWKPKHSLIKGLIKTISHYEVLFSKKNFVLKKNFFIRKGI